MTEPSAASDVVVLTGDFVGSTRQPAEALETSFAILGEACAELARWHGADTRLTRFRGDGWQALLARPDLTLRSVLYLRAALQSGGSALVTRIAAGRGALDRAGTGSLADADGTAPRAAGRLLDAMPRGRRFDFDGPGVTPGDRAAMLLADGIAARWTLAQAEALAQALRPDGPTQTEIGASFGIEQQSVRKRLKAAGIDALDAAIDILEGSAQRESI